MAGKPIKIEIGAALSAGFKAAVGSAQTQMNKLGSTISTLDKRQIGIAQLQKLSANANELGKAYHAANMRLKKTMKDNTRPDGTRSRDMQREVDKMARDAARAEQALLSERNALRELRKELQAAGVDTKKLGAESLKIGSQVELLRNRQGNLTRAREAKQRNSERGKQAAVGAMGLMAVGAVLAQPLMEFANFEAQMSRVSAVGKSTQEGQRRLAAEALRLGETTKFTAMEVGQGMEYLSLAGFNTQSTIDAIGGVLSVAAAAGTELDMTSGVIASTIRSMGMTAKDSARVGDVLTMTFTSSNTTLDSLGETLKYCAPVAAAVGMEFELLSTAIGVLGNAGIQGSSAGTSLRKMMLSLVSPSKNARTQMTKLGATAAEIESIMGDKNIAQRQAIVKLGIEVANPDGTMRDWEMIMRELSVKMGNLTQKERVSVSDALVGKTGISGFLAFMGAMNKDESFVEDAVVARIDELREQGLSELEIAKEIENFRESTKNSFDDLLTKNRAAQGTADAVAKKQLDNVKGGWTILNSAVSGFSIKLGSTLAGATREGTQHLTEFFGTLTGLIERFPRVTKAITLGTASALGLGIAFKLLIFAGSIIASPFLSANLALAKLTAGMAENAVAAGLQSSALAPGRYGAVGNAIRTLTPGIWGMNTALLTTKVTLLGISAPLWIVGAAIVGAAVLAYKYWDRLSAFLGGMWTGMKAGFAPVLEAFAPLEPLLTGIGSALSGLWSWFSELLTPVQSSTETLEAWGKAGEMVGQVLASAFDIVLIPVMGVVKAIGLVIEGVNWLWENGSKIGDFASDMGSSVKGWFGFGDNAREGVPTERGFGRLAPFGGNRSEEQFTAPTLGTQLRQAETMPKPAYLTPRPVASARSVTNSTTFNPTINITAPPGADASALAALVQENLRGMLPSMLPDMSGLYD